MRLTTKDILHLADLARLELGEDEIQSAGDDLEKILGYVERLANVPTDGVDPHTPPRREDWRVDRAIPCDDVTHDAIVQNFPDKQGALLKTPGVFAQPKG